MKGPRSALGCRPLNEFEALLVIQQNKVVMCYVAKPSLVLFVEKQEAGFTKMGSINVGKMQQSSNTFSQDKDTHYVGIRVSVKGC